MARMKICAEGELGNCWRRVIDEVLLLNQRIPRFYRTGIYAGTVSASNNNNNDADADDEDEDEDDNDDDDDDNDDDDDG